ncbi:MAG: hypothetical protein E7236_06925 [Lachnospiraceae bacterium]|nr:hypothetical protein [Lachnospiraceae bacterium]
MKRGSLMKRLTVFGLVAAVMGCMAMPALAAEDSDAYTIRIFSGEQGTYNGKDVTVLKKHVGDEVNIDPQGDTVLPEGSKYYVKGIREAGLDNNEAVSVTSYTVSGDNAEDRDYVIAYGIKGTSVAYTINYLDEAGNALADSVTYYGNVGDKPVVAYLYIEGYQPQAYNLTKTLLENEAENQFDFVYSVNAGETTTVTTTTTNTTTTTVAGAGTAGTAAAGTAAGGAAAGGAAAGGAAAGAAGEGGAAAPADIVDLDDQDVPLAGVDDTNGDNGDGTGVAGDEETINDDQVPTAGISTAAKAGIGVIIAAAIVAIIAALAVRARKKKKEDDVA